MLIFTSLRRVFVTFCGEVSIVLLSHFTGMADAFCFLGNEKSENLVLMHVIAKKWSLLITSMTSFLMTWLAWFTVFYLIIWCLLVAKQELLYKAVFSPANWKKKEKLFCFWLVICNMYSLKINSALLTDLYVFDEGKCC